MRLLRAAGTAVSEVAAILVEVVAIPARIAMRLAQRIGRTLLAIGRVVLPLVVLAGEAARGAIRIAERVVTPARALLAVVLCVVVTLGASQFADYRGVRVGAPQYRAVEAVSLTPQRDREDAIWAHGPWLLVVAGAAVAVTAFSLQGRWRLARMLSLCGAIVIVVSLAIDAPKGLREGQTAQFYEGTEAVLLGPFWVQLASGAVLLAAGPLLAAYLEAEAPAGNLTPGRRVRLPGVRGSRTQRAGT
jgi:hypothetical protein